MKRTQNMPRMSVTLDVSKLSGWLNAVAYCRVRKRGDMERGEIRVERREVAQAACRAGPDCGQE